MSNYIHNFCYSQLSHDDRCHKCGSRAPVLARFAGARRYLPFCWSHLIERTKKALNNQPGLANFPGHLRRINLENALEQFQEEQAEDMP